jgi:hypothetical protein
MEKVVTNVARVEYKQPERRPMVRIHQHIMEPLARLMLHRGHSLFAHPVVDVGNPMQYAVDKLVHRLRTEYDVSCNSFIRMLWKSDATRISYNNYLKYIHTTIVRLVNYRRSVQYLSTSTNLLMSEFLTVRREACGLLSYPFLASDPSQDSTKPTTAEMEWLVQVNGDHEIEDILNLCGTIPLVSACGKTIDVTVHQLRVMLLAHPGRLL